MRAISVPPNSKPTQTPAPLRTTDLAAALRGLRDTIAATRFPLPTPSAPAARAAAQALRTQLDDYLLPRVARLDAPVLAVVGGSTGAGKSTLVNSLVRAPVSPAGVLRPTTRGPVLVCHPADSAWFGARTLLPGLARASAPGEGVVQVVAAPKLVPGLALLDAPDIDSVVAGNRELAAELLGAADLWLFVTTAARYADAVPWSVLRAAGSRGAVVAVVLDRVAPEIRDDVAADLGRLLSEQGLPGAPLFVVHESTLDGQGLLPVGEVTAIESYLADVAANDARRRGVTRRTLLGAVAAAATTADDLAWATVEQVDAAEALVGVVREAYQRALSTVEYQLRAGAVLRGSAYARWRESVVSGEVSRALRAASDPARARPAPVLPGRALHAAIANALAALLVEAETAATDEITQRWRDDPAGRVLVDEGMADRNRVALAAGDVVRGWQAWLRQEARSAAPSTHSRTRSTASAATVLLATVAAVAAEPFARPTPADQAPETELPAAPMSAPEMPAIETPAFELPAIGAHDDALRQILTTDPVARLGERARAELLNRIEEFFSLGADRWRERIAELSIDADLVGRLRGAAAEVGVARQLTRGLIRAA